MSDEYDSWTLDDSTRATNPGNLRVNPFRWFRHYPNWPLIWFFSLALFVALACLGHWSFWIGASLLLVMNWLYWQRIREHFRSGDANPGIVVSMDPMMIAVSTDLTKGLGRYPVIKIIEKSLPTVCGQVPQIGSMLATVALYESSPDDNLPHWADFHPRPVDCATGNLAAMQRVMNTFTEADWNQLRSWLGQVPRPFRCGLFHIQIRQLTENDSGIRTISEPPDPEPSLPKAAATSIKTVCHQCGNRYRVKESLAGKRIKCPGCGAAIAVLAAELHLDELEELQPMDDRLAGGVVKIAVMADGTVYVNSEKVPIDSLSSKLDEIGEVKEIWYYREAPEAAEPHENAMKAIAEIANRQLPIAMYLDREFKQRANLGGQ